VWCNGTWGTTQYQTATISSTQQIGEIGTGPPMLISPSGLASVSVNDTPRADQGDHVGEGDPSRRNAGHLIAERFGLN
jgi:hypothetical protein